MVESPLAGAEVALRRVLRGTNTTVRSTVDTTTTFLRGGKVNVAFS
jgi:hypothetical protein